MKLETQGIGTYLDALLVTILYYSQATYCIYEDQIGKFDWQHEYMGYVTNIFIGKVIGGSRQILLVTEQNILASLKSDGNLVWRNILEPPHYGNIKYSMKKGNDLLTIQKDRSLRIFDAISGLIKKDISFKITNGMTYHIDKHGYIISIYSDKFLVHSSLPNYSKKLTGNHSFSNLPSHFVSYGKDYFLINFDSGHSVVTINDLNNLNNPIKIKIDFLNYIACDLNTQTVILFDTGKILRYDLKNQKYHLYSFKEMDIATIKINAYESNENHDFNFYIFSKWSKEFGLYGIGSNNTIYNIIKLENVAEVSANNEDNSSPNKPLYILKAINNDHNLNDLYRKYDLYVIRIDGDEGHKTAQEHFLYTFQLRTGREIDKFVIVENELSDQDLPDLLIVIQDYAITYIKQGHIAWIREESLAYPNTVEVMDLPLKDKHAIAAEQQYLDSNMKHPFLPFRVVYRVYYQLADLYYEILKTLNDAYLWGHQISTTISSFVKDVSSEPNMKGLPLQSLFHRFKNQLQSRKAAVGYQPWLSNRYAVYMNESGYGRVYRDNFNIRKLIVIVTDPGKVFGIDSKTGQIIYSLSVSHLLQPFSKNEENIPKSLTGSLGVDESEFLSPIQNNISNSRKYLLYIMRSTSHYPHEPLAVVFGKSRKTHSVSYVLFNPITGVLASQDESHSTSGDGHLYEDIDDIGDIKQISQLPFTNLDLRFIKPVILVGDADKIQIFPPYLSQAMANYAPNILSIYQIHPSGNATGHMARASSSTNEFKIFPSWSINLFSSKNQIITSITTKKPNERIDSPGKILEDGDVLYRYINPNLVVVVGECIPSLCPTPYFDVVLFDGINGNVIYSTRHKKCVGPVHVINTENWILYTYHNAKQRRREMAIIYLYTGKHLIKSQKYSAFDRSLNRFPLVETRSFIFPLHCDVTAISTTYTEFGLTQKKILMALANGKIYEFSRELLDQRFSSQKSKDTKALVFYVPELPFFTQQVLNYNRSVFGIKGFKVTPTGLESTAIVYAYGLDSYCTRIIPSNYFDVLKDDFDRWIIIAVLIILTIASIVSQKLAARKELNVAWA